MFTCQLTEDTNNIKTPQAAIAPEELEVIEDTGFDDDCMDMTHELLKDLQDLCDEADRLGAAENKGVCARALLNYHAG